MSKTYIIKSTDSDLTGGADFNKALTAGTQTTSSLTINLAASETRTSYGYTAAADPGTMGYTGNYTVEMNITTGDNNVYGSTYVARVNSSGVQQAISSASTEQKLSAGVKSFTHTAADLGTWASGDRLRVSYVYRNSSSKATASVIMGTGTTDCEVVAPFGNNYTQACSDALILSDTVAKTTSKPISDALVLSDAITKTPIYGRVFSETLSLTEFLTKFTSKTISSSLVLSEILIKQKSVNYQLQVDKTSNAFGDLELNLDTSSSVTNWQYYDGSWLDFPTGGIYVEGYRIQYNASGLTDGTKYWRACEKGSGDWSNTGIFIVSTGGGKSQTCTEALILSEVFTTTGSIYSRTLTETLVLSETIYKSLNRNLSDSLVLSDEILKISNKNLIETHGLSEELFKLPSKLFSETVILSEELTKSLNRNLSEVLVLSESLNNSIEKLLSETLILLEDLIVEKVSGVKTQTCTETIILSEILSKSIFKTLTDALELIEILTKTLNRTLSENLVLDDTISKGPSKFLTESLSLSESLFKFTIKGLTDAFVLSDDKIIYSSKVLSETLVLNEIINKTTTMELIETVSLSEALVKTSSKSLTDTLVLSEETSKTTIKLVSDTLSLNETISMQSVFNRSFLDTLVLVEALSYESTGMKTKTVSDALILTEAGLVRDVQVSRSDVLILVEDLTKYVSRTILDDLILVEDLNARTIPKISVSDALVLDASKVRRPTIQSPTDGVGTDSGPVLLFISPELAA